MFIFVFVVLIFVDQRITPQQIPLFQQSAVGLDYLGQFWYKGMTAAPDLVCSLHHTFVKVRSDGTSSIKCCFALKGTQISVADSGDPDGVARIARYQAKKAAGVRGITITEAAIVAVAPPKLVILPSDLRRKEHPRTVSPSTSTPGVATTITTAATFAARAATANSATAASKGSSASNTSSSNNSLLKVAVFNNQQKAVKAEPAPPEQNNRNFGTTEIGIGTTAADTSKATVSPFTVSTSSGSSSSSSADEDAGITSDNEMSISTKGSGQSREVDPLTSRNRITFSSDPAVEPSARSSADTSNTCSVNAERGASDSPGEMATLKKQRIGDSSSSVPVPVSVPTLSLGIEKVDSNESLSLDSARANGDIHHTSIGSTADIVEVQGNIGQDKGEDTIRESPATFGPSTKQGQQKVVRAPVLDENGKIDWMSMAEVAFAAGTLEPCMSLKDKQYFYSDPILDGAGNTVLVSRSGGINSDTDMAGMGVQKIESTGTEKGGEGGGERGGEREKDEEQEKGNVQAPPPSRKMVITASLDCICSIELEMNADCKIISVTLNYFR